MIKIDFLKKLRLASFLLALFVYCSMYAVHEQAPQEKRTSVNLLDRGIQKKNTNRSVARIAHKKSQDLALTELKED